MNKYRYPSVVLWRRIPNSIDGNPIEEKSDKENNYLMDTPAHGTYGGLLFHPRWKERRAQVLVKDGGRCVICDESQELQVHHRQYHFFKDLKCFKAPWDYEDRFLITLCKSCHNRGHSKYKVPTIVI